MKLLLLVPLIAVASAFAQTQVAPTAKSEIPPDRQEAISQAMLALQQAQLFLQGTKLEARDFIDKATKKLTDAQAKYDALQEALRIEFKVAKDCQLTLTKTWQCPSQVPPAKPK